MCAEEKHRTLNVRCVFGIQTLQLGMKDEKFQITKPFSVAPQDFSRQTESNRKQKNGTQQDEGKIVLIFFFKE